jgi:hypothetical protein
MRHQWKGVIKTNISHHTWIPMKYGMTSCQRLSQIRTQRHRHDQHVATAAVGLRRENCNCCGIQCEMRSNVKFHSLLSYAVKTLKQMSSGSSMTASCGML